MHSAMVTSKIYLFSIKVYSIRATRCTNNLGTENVEEVLQWAVGCFSNRDEAANDAFSMQ